MSQLREYLYLLLIYSSFGQGVAKLVIYRFSRAGVPLEYAGTVEEEAVDLVHLEQGGGEGEVASVRGVGENVVRKPQGAHLDTPSNPHKQPGEGVVSVVPGPAAVSRYRPCLTSASADVRDRLWCPRHYAPRRVLAG